MLLCHSSKRQKAIIMWKARQQENRRLQQQMQMHNKIAKIPTKPPLYWKPRIRPNRNKRVGRRRTRSRSNPSRLVSRPAPTTETRRPRVTTWPRSTSFFRNPPNKRQCHTGQARTKPPTNSDPTNSLIRRQTMAWPRAMMQKIRPLRRNKFTNSSMYHRPRPIKIIIINVSSTAKILHPPVLRVSAVRTW